MGDVTDASDVLTVSWTGPEELVLVAESLLSRRIEGWKDALDLIQIWSQRVERMTTGCETSMYLLQAFLYHHEVSSTQEKCGSELSKSSEKTPDVLKLALSSAINRFLNLSSQIGEKRLGLSNYFDVAKAFMIPDWVVQLRHETTHGHMSSLETLKLGLDFALQWVIKNYWEPELASARKFLMAGDSNYDAIKSSMEYKKLHKLLDCYGYLRIYSIWGTKNIGQLAEQEELYEYIKELWLDFQVQKDTKGRKRLTDIGQVHLKEALNTIKSELTSYLDKGRKEFKTEFLHKVLAYCLVNDELLIPSREFLDSLKDDSNGCESDHDIALPKNLKILWFQILVEVEEFGGLPELLSSLTTKVRTAQTQREASIAVAWVKEICRIPEDAGSLGQGLFNRRQKTTKKKPEPLKSQTRKSLLTNEIMFNHGSSFNDFVTQVLNSPSETHLEILPLVLRLRRPRLSLIQERSLIHLMEVALGLKSLRKDPEDNSPQVMTVEDIVTGAHGTSQADTPSLTSSFGHWKAVTNPEIWRSLPFGVSHGQHADDMYKITKARAGGDEVFFSPNDGLFQVETINWQSLMQKQLPEEDQRSAFLNRSSPSSQYGGGNKEELNQEVPVFYRNDTKPDSSRFNGGAKKKRKY